MVLATLEAVTKAHGTAVLLDAVTLGVADFAKIGVVGRNGAGKTTLLRVLCGLEPPDAGRVVHAGGLRLGLLHQGDTVDDRHTVGQAVLGPSAGTGEWERDATARGVVDGLGLRPRLADPVGPMSGGERRRVALAALLVRELDLLVLDEPTNHLDVEAAAWLASHLAARRHAVVAVTHDRWFLDEVCDRTWEVADGSVHAYDGGYAAYVLARAERSRQEAATSARRSNLLRKELAWLRRGPPARTSKPRFRIEAANALIADEPPARDTVRLRTFSAARLGRSVLDVEDVTLALGGRPLLTRLTWRLGPGDRVGLVGVNGSGKTSLLRLLDGELLPDAGRVRRGATVRLAHLSQQVAELDPSLRVLQAVEEVARVLDVGGGRELSAGQLLEMFGMRPERQWTPVGDLSGGERRRLQLLRLLMTGPNVLLLDEPTNDLDIDTLTALEDVLDGWPGTLVVVSHDRWFLERTCDTVSALLGDGTLAALPGGVEEYLARRRQAVLTPAGGTPPSTAPAAGSSPGPADPSTAAQTRAARKELTRLERTLERLERRERDLHVRLAEVATDHEEVLRLDTELRAVAAERAGVEDAWLELAGQASAG